MGGLCFAKWVHEREGRLTRRSITKNQATQSMGLAIVGDGTPRFLLNQQQEHLESCPSSDRESRVSMEGDSARE
jgi:hypothetical protein